MKLWVVRNNTVHQQMLLLWLSEHSMVLKDIPVASMALIPVVKEALLCYIQVWL